MAQAFPSIVSSGSPYDFGAQETAKMAFDPVSTGATVAGTVASAGAAYFGQRKADKAAAERAREQREWQERMSSTAYQRAVADMRAAGINPMVAAMGHSASTPSGAVAPVGNAIGSAVQSALAAKAAFADTRRALAEARGAEASAQAQEYVNEGLKNLSIMEKSGVGMIGAFLKTLNPLKGLLK